MFGSVAGRPHGFNFIPASTTIPLQSGTAVVQVPPTSAASEEAKDNEPSSAEGMTRNGNGSGEPSQPPHQQVIYITSAGVQSQASRKREARGIINTYLGFWVMLEICAAAFLVTFLYLPNFSELRFSPSCQIVNSASGQRQGTWFLQLYSGFSAQRSLCTAPSAAAADAGTLLCIPWTDAVAWQRFEQAAGFWQTTYPDTVYTLKSAQALVPCSLFFLVLALGLHSLVLCSSSLPERPAIWSFRLAAWMLLLSWILLISAQSVILYAPPFVPSLWTSFFRQGYTLGHLVSTDPLPAPTAAEAAANIGCAVTFACECFKAFNCLLTCCRRVC